MFSGRTIRSEILRIMIHSVISHNKACHSRPVSWYGVNSSGNPTAVPAKTGSHSKYWIPGQARNDKQYKMLATMYAIPMKRKRSTGSNLLFAALTRF